MTRRLTVGFEAGEVVVVPFPFTDRLAAKRRPALVLSNREHFNAPSGHSVMAMITSHKDGKTAWPLDVPITDLAASGLSAPSLVRFKLFTLDHRLVLRAIGTLGPLDQRGVMSAMKRVLSR